MFGKKKKKHYGKKIETRLDGHGLMDSQDEPVALGIIACIGSEMGFSTNQLATTQYFLLTGISEPTERNQQHSRFSQAVLGSPKRGTGASEQTRDSGINVLFC